MGSRTKTPGWDHVLESIDGDSAASRAPGFTVDEDDKTIVSVSPFLNPEANEPRLTLPVPGSQGSSMAPLPAAPRASDAHIAETFSQDLQVPRRAPVLSTPGPSEVPWWREYREVLAVTGLGLLIVAVSLAITGSRGKSSGPAESGREFEAETQEVNPRAVVARTAAAPNPVEASNANPVPEIAQPERPTTEGATAGGTPESPESPPSSKSIAVPVLTVVSSPPGAWVEIGGVVYGRTPLITPGPTDRESIEILLRHPKFENHVENVIKNEAGHFSLNVVLRPKR
jgi:hypothetical protein